MGFQYFNHGSKQAAARKRWMRERTLSTAASAIQDGIDRGKIVRSPAPERPCPCGAPRRKGHIVCLACYKAAPGSARDLFRTLRTRRAGVRALLEFARTQTNETT